MPIIREPLDKGWLPDLIPYLVPEGGLTETSGVIPTAEGYRPDLTYVQYGTGNTSTNKPLRCATFIHSNGLAYTFIGTATKIYRLNPDKTMDDVTKSGATYNATDWHFAQYGNWLVAVNSFDSVQVLKDFAANADTSGNPLLFVDLGGNPGTASYVLSYMGHMMLFNTRVYNELVTNGSFTGNANGWTLQTGATYGTNNISLAWHIVSLIEQTIPHVVGTTYKITVDVSNYPAYFIIGLGNVYASDNRGLTSEPIPGGYRLTAYITPTTTDVLRITWSALPASATLDNVSVKAITTRGSKWSSLENIEDWSTVATGADSQDFPELEGAIIGIARLPNGFCIFSEGGTIINGYHVGGVFTFQFGWQLPDRGCFRNSFVSTNRGIYLWSKKDICFYDGQSLVSIAQGIRRTVFGASATYGLSRTYAANIHGWYDAENQLVYYAYPISATVLNLICYSIERNIWTFVGAYTASTFFPMYDDGIVSNVPELAYTYQDTNWLIKSRIDGSIDATNPYITTREFGGADMGVYTFQRVRPRVKDNTADLTVTVKTRMNENASTTDTATVTVPVNGTGWADFTATARYHRIKTTLGGGEIGDLFYEAIGTGQQ